MQGVDPIQTIRYAVIEVVYSNAHSERIVLEYTTPATLRELIAGSRIVGSDFQSRIEAYELANTSLGDGTAQDPRRGRSNGGSLVSMVQAILRRLVTWSLHRPLSRALV
jgi:hypothetical protein